MQQIEKNAIKSFSLNADPSVFLKEIKMYFEDASDKTDLGEATLYHVLAQMNGTFTDNILSYFMTSCSSSKNGIQLKPETFDKIIEEALKKCPSKYEVREHNKKLYDLGTLALSCQDYTLAVKLYTKYRENYELNYSDSRLNGYKSANMIKYLLDDEKKWFNDFTLAIASVYFLGKPGVPKNPIKAAQIIDLTGYEMNPYDENRALISEEVTAESLVDPEFYFMMAEYLSLHGAFTEANYSPFEADRPTDYDPEAVEISVVYPLKFFVNAYRGGAKQIPRAIGRALHMGWQAGYGACHPENETHYNSFRITCLLRALGNANSAIDEEIKAENMDAIFEDEIRKSLDLRRRARIEKNFESHSYTKYWKKDSIMRCIDSGNADAEYLLGLFYRYLDGMEGSYKCVSHAAATGSEKAKRDLPNYKKKLFGPVYEAKDKRFMTFYKDVKPNK